MEYTTRYGLEFDPFVKNSRESIIEYGDFVEATTRLNYLKQIKKNDIYHRKFCCQFRSSNLWKALKY